MTEVASEGAETLSDKFVIPAEMMVWLDPAVFANQQPAPGEDGWWTGEGEVAPEAAGRASDDRRPVCNSGGRT